MGALAPPRSGRWSTFWALGLLLVVAQVPSRAAASDRALRVALVHLNNAIGDPIQLPLRVREALALSWPKETAPALRGTLECIDALLREQELLGDLDRQQARALARQIRALDAPLMRCAAAGVSGVHPATIAARRAALREILGAVEEADALTGVLDEQVREPEARRRAGSVVERQRAELAAALRATLTPEDEIWPRVRALWRAVDPPPPSPMPTRWSGRSSAPGIVTVVLGAVPVILAVPILGSLAGILPPWPSVGGGLLLGLVAALPSALAWETRSRGLAIAGTVLGGLTLGGSLALATLAQHDVGRWFAGGLLAGSVLNLVWLFGAWGHAHQVVRAERRAARRWRRVLTELSPAASPAFTGLSWQRTF
ncbi:MAG: hypothetical protein KF901_11915 [Myxococcales bacterium]|nr:hypothetical protein [Myxococcales bacterium]